MGLIQSGRSQHFVLLLDSDLGMEYEDCEDVFESSFLKLDREDLVVVEDLIDARKKDKY